MRRPLQVVALALLPLVPVSLVAQTAQDLRLVRFVEYIEALRTQAGIPGLAAAIVGTRDIQWEAAFGRQDVDRAIATRTDTPFPLNGLTQILTTALVLRCVEEGRLSLDTPTAAAPALTPRQILTHSSGPSGAAAFAYDPSRFAALGPEVEACTGRSFRVSMIELLERLAMFDSAPGSDIVQLTPGDPDAAGGDDVPDAADLDRYQRVLGRLATSYSVDRRGRPRARESEPVPLTPADGLISTVLDYAHFDLALKQGLLLLPGTVTDSWIAPVGADDKRLPHGFGWFVQIYRGETIVWQFGLSENASSSLVVMVPSRGLTLVLLANSSGLARGFALEEGDLTVSPFGRLFLEIFVR